MILVSGKSGSVDPRSPQEISFKRSWRDGVKDRGFSMNCRNSDQQKNHAKTDLID